MKVKTREEAAEPAAPRDSSQRPRSSAMPMIVAAVIGVVAIAAVAVWLLSGGSDDAAEVEQTIRDVVAAENAGDAETFLSFWTDAGLASYDSGTREEILSGEAPLGEDQIDIVAFPDITVSGDTATGVVQAAIHPVLYEVSYDLIRQDDRWLINGWEFRGSAAPPAGTETVEVTLTDFAFGFDAAALSSGDFALSYRNAGEQEHEILLIRFEEEGLTMQELLDRAAETNGDEEPEGMSFVGFLGFAAPGENGSTTFTEALEPGRYAFICMMPDTDGTPHAFKGMAAEFAVG